MYTCTYTCTCTGPAKMDLLFDRPPGVEEAEVDAAATALAPREGVEELKVGDGVAHVLRAAKHQGALPGGRETCVHVW